MSGLWFEVAAVTHREDAEVKDIEGNNVLIRGHVDNLLVIQVPTGVDHNQILQGVQRMLQAENIDKGVFVVDDKIEIMKLVPVERAKAKVLEAKHQAVKLGGKQNAPTTRTPQ